MHINDLYMFLDENKKLFKILVNFIPRLWLGIKYYTNIRQPMLKLKIHTGFHVLF